MALHNTPLHLIDNPALPPAHLAFNVIDELALRDENGKEVSEEDPAAVQSALKALQDSSDASVLKNKEIQEVELKKNELSNNVRRSGPRY